MVKYAILMSDHHDNTFPRQLVHMDLVERYGAVEWYLTCKNKLLLTFSSDHPITGREFFDWTYWRHEEDQHRPFILFAYDEEQGAYFRQVVTVNHAMELYTQKDNPTEPQVFEFSMITSVEDTRAAVAYLRGECAALYRVLPSEDGTWRTERIRQE